MKKIRNVRIALLILIPLCIICMIIAFGLGPVPISPLSTIKVIIGQIPFIGDGLEYSELEYNVIWVLRVPRVLLGFVVGASLAACGVAMQALVRNKLADPFILGVSSGASATATLGMITGWFAFLGAFELAFNAFIGAAVCIILVYMISKTRGRINVTTLLLAGVAIAMIMDALTKAMALGARNALAVHNLDFWMTGSLAGAKWDFLALPTIVMLLCIVYLMFNYRTLNALLMGEETAITLGVNVERTQKYLVLVSSLLAGVTISVSGAIGFVGMMVPHIARMFFGSNHKIIIPISAVLGGILVVCTDVVARTIMAPAELPVGIITAIIGGPVFILLLKRSSGRTS